jgi:hypothetical protein
MLALSRIDSVKRLILMYLNIVVKHTVEISITIESCGSLVRLEVFKLDNDIRPAGEHGVHKP